MVEVEKGGYCLTPASGDAEEDRMSFRFFLDFPKGATRNDVELPAERVFFTSCCWRQDDEQLKEAYRIKGELEDQIAAVTKDYEDVKYQLRSGNPGWIQRCFAFRNLILVKEKRDVLERTLKRHMRKNPLDEKKIVRGPHNLIFAKEGYMTVKRYVRLSLLRQREEYHCIGKFTIKEFVDDINNNNDMVVQAS
mmetsp:Transcript_12211/g.18618  ORF Transcript_12211/g.18618 Transcript_12211/m.18618 type:complete len:193 (+) Transcript_12211:3-581(+)